MVETKETVIVNLTKKEKNILNLFKIFLFKMRVPEIDYCIGNVEEMAFCVIKENNIWQTFYYESGHKHFKQDFDNVISACYDITRRFEKSINKESLIAFKQQIKELEIDYSNTPSKTKKINRKAT